MQKIKSFKLSEILSIIKCSLIGVVATLICTVIFAVILKFVNISSSLIGYINNAIKILAIFVVVMCVKRNSSEKILLKSVFAGLIYSILCFVVFSILNGGFTFSLSILYDLLFAGIVSVVVTIILNLVKHKSL